jgi:hypothetical protein
MAPIFLLSLASDKPSLVSSLSISKMSPMLKGSSLFYSVLESNCALTCQVGGYAGDCRRLLQSERSHSYQVEVQSILSPHRFFATLLFMDGLSLLISPFLHSLRYNSELSVFIDCCPASNQFLYPVMQTRSFSVVFPSLSILHSIIIPHTVLICCVLCQN